MTNRLFRPLPALILTLLVATPASAANKEHQQLMADLRMLQEQTQLLQNMLGTLTEALKAVNARLDQQAEATPKIRRGREASHRHADEGSQHRPREGRRQQRPRGVAVAGSRCVPSTGAAGAGAFTGADDGPHGTGRDSPAACGRQHTCSGTRTATTGRRVADEDLRAGVRRLRRRPLGSGDRRLRSVPQGLSHGHAGRRARSSTSAART